MEKTFKWCVDLLVAMADFFNVSYVEINVIIFVYIVPLVFILFVVSWWIYRQKYFKLKDKLRL